MQVGAPNRRLSARSELSAALWSCKGAIVGVAGFSAIINILMLTGAFYMLQVYDRVLTSGSLPTLVALSVLAVFLLLMMGVLDMIRARILVRVGGALDQDLGRRVFNSIATRPLRSGRHGDGLQPMRDLDTIRTFIGSPGPPAFFDMPWMPVYIGIIFLFHPVLGIAAIVGALILIALTATTEAMTRDRSAKAAGYGQMRNTLANAGWRNAEVVTALGMRKRIGDLWRSANNEFVGSHRGVTDVSGSIGAISRSLRMVLQSAMLGIGAYLVIQEEASPGIIIAGAILAGRALAPVDQAIAQWRGFVSARQSWKRLGSLLAELPETPEPMALPSPFKSLSVEKVGAVAPGKTTQILHNISFSVKMGHILGIIGPSASGKSSLARLLVGAWKPAGGRVCLDGASLEQWSPEALGPHIGYLPQDVELFAGTVGQNIARFDPDASPEAIVAAARAAGTHEMITTLAEGYDTDIGEQGQDLSAGQRQRVALARALYGDPFLIVLDEPNSNLDAEGEAALMRALMAVRMRGGIVILIAHRAGTLTSVDSLLVLAQGRVVQHGPRDTVLASLQKQAPAKKAVPAMTRDAGQF